MLQQTQVATVIDYYNKWMKVGMIRGVVVSCCPDPFILSGLFLCLVSQRWPTVQDLAAATLEVIE